MYHRVLAVYVFASVMLACTPQPTPNPPPQPDADAASAVDAGPLTGGPCEQAFQLATAMGCPLKAPSTGTWVQACNNARANGIDMHTKCVLGAASCSAVAYCLE